MAARRAASTTDSPRTVRACLSRAPVDAGMAVAFPLVELATMQLTTGARLCLTAKDGGAGVPAAGGHLVAAAPGCPHAYQEARVHDRADGTDRTDGRHAGPRGRGGLRDVFHGHAPDDHDAPRGKRDGPTDRHSGVRADPTRV